MDTLKYQFLKSDARAKPMIDVIVAVNHQDDAEKCIEPLASIDYEYVPEYGESMSERRYFQRQTTKRTTLSLAYG